MKAGQTIPGSKVHGRGSQVWALPGRMAAKLTGMGIPKSAIWETKLVTPAKVEKNSSGEATKAGEGPEQLSSVNSDAGHRSMWPRWLANYRGPRIDTRKPWCWMPRRCFVAVPQAGGSPCPLWLS